MEFIYRVNFKLTKNVSLNSSSHLNDDNPKSIQIFLFICSVVDFEKLYYFTATSNHFLKYGISGGFNDQLVHLQIIRICKKADIIHTQYLSFLQNIHEENETSKNTRPSLGVNGQEYKSLLTLYNIVSSYQELKVFVSRTTFEGSKNAASLSISYSL
jgi:hypothetical protein